MEPKKRDEELFRECVKGYFQDLEEGQRDMICDGIAIKGESAAFWRKDKFKKLVPKEEDKGIDECGKGCDRELITHRFVRNAKNIKDFIFGK